MSKANHHWVRTRLGDTKSTISTGPFGTMLHKSDYVEDGIPLVNPMNIVGSEIVPSTKMMVSEDTKRRLENYVLRKGDVVIARRGELGRCAVGLTPKMAGFVELDRSSSGCPVRSTLITSQLFFEATP